MKVFQNQFGTSTIVGQFPPKVSQYVKNQSQTLSPKKKNFPKSKQTLFMIYIFIIVNNQKNIY